MLTSAGTFLKSFEKWKNLPERNDTEAFKKGSKFEKSLNIFVRNTIKKSFDPIKEINFDAEGKKKWCIRVLFEKSMTENKR
jgi:hypothetical protein